MAATTVVQYLTGLAFLALLSLIAALPFAFLIQRKSLAVLFSVLTSTLLLKVWAYIVLGGFDFVFLLLLIVIGLVMATLAKTVTDWLHAHSSR